MVALTALWLPILVSAVFVFLASALIHMALGYHAADYGRAPSEDAVMDALRGFSIPPGDYMLPCPGRTGGRDPEFAAKHKKGPVVIMTVLPAGDMRMGKQLVMWFVYCLVVGLFAGYLTSRAQPAGAPYLEVFRFASTVAFAGYALALWPLSIWYRRQLGTTIRSTVDGLIYSLLTGGAFGWLWPS
ncbi:MAG: hypothetical protein HY824_10480 [Acidobacteria bacterium]|nr:hypothetical protein [Acidobacteriota bacterium]